MEQIPQQLARQLQVEEEQKAKVLVKLEEVMVVSKSETLNSALACIPNAQIKESTTVESSEQQRRKNNRSSSKNKHKLDDLPAIATVPKETNYAEKLSTESGKTKASELMEFNPSSVQSRADAKHVIQPSEEHYSSLSVGQVNTQLKSQHTRRLPRRMADKFHSSDNFIWAPKNKAEVQYEAYGKTETAKSDDLVHNNLKSKGAEVERCDPKLVSKELALQTSLDGTLGGAEPLQSIETCQPGNSATGIEGSENKVDIPKSFGPGSGRSSYAKKRRAKKLGICHRCCLTTCNGEYGVCQRYVEGGGDSDITLSCIKSYVLYGLSNSEPVETQTEVETHAGEGRVGHDVQREA